MYAVRSIGGAEATAYASYTYPAYRGVLDRLDGRTLLATGAALFDSPVGLALARLQRADRRAELLSIAVASTDRRRGIGTALLARLERDLAAQGCDRVLARYTVADGADQEFRHIFFSRNGWQPPIFSAYICETDVEHVRSAGWLVRSYRLPERTELKRWVDLDAAERCDVQDRLRGDLACPDNLSPFANPEPMEPANSLVLLERGRVAGWMITHRLDAQTIRYTNLYVRPELQRTGVAMKLMVAAIRLQALTDLGRSVTRGIWVWSAENFQVRFLERHMRPYLTRLARTYRIEKAVVADA